LKKILEFIEGQEERYCQDIELSIDPIFESHNWSGSWKTMSDERLQCLMPYTNESFWIDLCNFPADDFLRDPKDLSIEEMRAVFHGILK
jgi:hypothetical protein